MGTPRSDDLRRLAQRVADALPAEVAEEVVLTGSVSRGVADEVSDIEMLIVTSEALSLDECSRLAGGAGLGARDSWGPRDGPARRVSGRCEGVSLELTWWPRDYALSQIDVLLAGHAPSTADALVHGVPLRTKGLLAAWQARLSQYPLDLVGARCEEAALPWGGFAAAGLLTLIRPDDRLALSEWLVDAAMRVLMIVFAVNRVWQPTSKRLAMRVAPLGVKPDRLAERIEEALNERDPRRALLVMTELQLEAVSAAPSGPNVDRARAWLAEGAKILRREAD